MKFVKNAFFSFALLLSIQSKAGSIAETEAELQHVVEHSQLQAAAAERALTENTQAKNLFETLALARKDELSALEALAVFKLNHRSYARIAYDFAMKHKELAAVITVAALCGALIHKLFFVEECYIEEFDDFDYAS